MSERLDVVIAALLAADARERRVWRWYWLLAALAVVLVAWWMVG